MHIPSHCQLVGMMHVVQQHAGNTLGVQSSKSGHGAGDSTQKGLRCHHHV